MREDKYLLNDLNNDFDSLKHQLTSDGQFICQKEIERVRGTLNQVNKLTSKRIFSRDEEPLLLEVVNTFRQIIQKIDQEGATLEIEMQGVQNFSFYYQKHLSDYAFKKKFRDALLKCLNKIYSEHPELKERALDAL